MSFRFSVGIPTYNQVEYLEATLASLLAQDTAPYEIVVSDNWCTDETPRLLEKYKNSIRVVRPERHLNMMENWNFVVSQMDCDWFSLLSSDDIAHPNFFTSLQEGIKKSDDAVLVRAGYETNGADGAIIQRRLILSAKEKMSFPDNFIEQLKGPKVCFSSFAAKRSGWETAGGFPPECTGMGDWGLWLRLAPHGDFVYVPKIISQYRSYERTEKLKIERVRNRAEDEYFVASELMAPLAEAAGIGSARWQAGMRERLGDFLTYLQDNQYDPNHEAYTASIKRLAMYLNAEDAFADFQNGQFKNALPLKRRLRQYAGRVAHFF